MGGYASSGPGTSARVAEGRRHAECKKVPNTLLVHEVARHQVAVTAS